MTEQELILRLEEYRRSAARRETAGDGGVHCMDEVLRELLAGYQPLVPSGAGSRAPELVAC